MTAIVCHECEKSQKIVGICVRCGGFNCEQCARWCPDCQRLLCIGCGDRHLANCEASSPALDEHRYGYCGSELCR